MCRPVAVLGVSLISISGWAQQYVISTVAGGVPPSTPSAAAAASIGDPPRVALDSTGNVYFASIHSVFKVDTSGKLTRIAGTGRSGVSGDGGPALSAQFSFPQGLAVDAAGNIYVADRDANVVRRISAAGTVSALAGTGTAGFAGDGGIAVYARLNGPTGLALDATGDLFIADTNNNVIRKVAPSGTITTVAGNTVRGMGGDGGLATQAVLNGPEGVAADGVGNLYIADTFNHRIRRVGADGIITTFAANGYPGYGGDNGPALNATLDLPTDVAVDRKGNVYIADFGTGRIRLVKQGTISTVAGSTSGIQPIDGADAVFVRLSGPTGVAVDSSGAIYFAEGSVGSGSGLAAGDFKVWKVSGSGVLSTVAGDGNRSFSGDFGPAALAQLDSPSNIAIDSRGNLYIADTENNRIRRISPDGLITTVAGFGGAGFAGDGGHAASALLNHPMGVAVDADGNILIADTGNNRVRVVSPAGNIGTVAGNGNAALYGDGGNALLAALHSPQAVAVGPDHALYIADTEDHRIRKVVNGIIDTVAGQNGGLLVAPSSLAVDPAGNVFIADPGSGRILKLTAAGALSSAAGGDSSLGSPQGVAADSAGNIYVTDAAQGRVRKIAADGTVASIAGNGQCCYTNDGGAAPGASLNAPWGIAADQSGNIYFADSGNDAIRLLQPEAAVGTGFVANAASNQGGPIAPGEIVAIFGQGIGPAQAAQLQTLDAQGLVGVELGGVRVLFNGIYAPILYASATQVTAVVPYAVSGSAVKIEVEWQSRTVLTTSAPLAPTAPALFTADATGRGQALALNADGTRNSVTNPARAGSTVTLYATGEGQTNPAGIDGKLAGTAPPQPAAAVSAAIGGLTAEVESAGGSPGSVAGLMQVTVKVPGGLQPGLAAVAIQVGAASSQSGVTIVVGR